MGYFYLGVAIVAEVIATTLMKATERFTRPGLTVLVLALYGCAMCCLAQVLTTIPVGIAYAIWSGLGIVLITASSAVFYRQTPDLPAIVGMGLIIAGTVVINLWSKMAVH